MPNQHPAAPASTSKGPYRGIRVLDFCSAIAGSYSAALLGDLGADVIKFEPVGGDPARQWGPFFAGESRMFMGWNRNKRSIAIDLRAAEGLDVVRRLTARADVLIENFRPGVAEKLGFGHDALREVNPRLIYCSTTGFGARGPWRDRPAYDPILQAMSGTTLANGGPNYCGAVGSSSVAAVDYTAAMLVFSAVGAALFHRERTGEGQRVETSLLHAAFAVQAHSIMQAVHAPPEAAPGIYPNRIFRTREGLVHITAPTERFWKTFCETIGAPELLADYKYKTNRDRTHHAAGLTVIIEEKLAAKSAVEWDAIFLERDIPCGVVSDYETFLNLPQVAAMGMNPVVEHPTVGPIRMPGVAVEFEKTPGAIQHAAPILGEHTRQILMDIGYDQQRIVELARAGVIVVG